jgi:hypothetical protein
LPVNNQQIEVKNVYIPVTVCIAGGFVGGRSASPIYYKNIEVDYINVSVAVKVIGCR